MISACIVHLVGNSWTVSVQERLLFLRKSLNSYYYQVPCQIQGNFSPSLLSNGSVVSDKNNFFFMSQRVLSLNCQVVASILYFQSNSMMFESRILIKKYYSYRFLFQNLSCGDVLEIWLTKKNKKKHKFLKGHIRNIPTM